MLTVSSAEFHRNFGRYQDLALTEPVVVTSYRRERVVLISVAEYRRLVGLRTEVAEEAEIEKANRD
jgi:prevent-host-death family protein